MKVLIVHNKYRQPGGEDAVVDAEASLLERHGMEVIPLIFENADVDERSFTGKLRAVRDSIWSSESYRQVFDACVQHKPDIAHVHNFWMRVSPSVHTAFRDAAVPSVQSLHNYRLTCANGLMLRDQHVCGDCVGRLPWRAVVHRCYRDSSSASAAVAAMIAYHRVRGTWNAVDAFIAVSDYVRRQLAASSIPADRVFVKSNFTPEPGGFWSAPSRSDYLFFAGRLSVEKGCRELLHAWITGRLREYGRLLIAGSGPEAAALREQAGEDHRIEFLGACSPPRVQDLMQSARAVVVPSIWHEPFGLTAIEAYSCGRPVLAARRGALSEIVRSGYTGRLFDVNDVADTVAALRQALLDPQMADAQGASARKEYLREYTPERNFEMLTSIYRRVISSSREGKRCSNN